MRLRQRINVSEFLSDNPPAPKSLFGSRFVVFHQHLIRLRECSPNSLTMNAQIAFCHAFSGAIDKVEALRVCTMHRIS
jgi:hypothetical protein